MNQSFKMIVNKFLIYLSLPLLHH